jgi:hypothetical protein
MIFFLRSDLVLAKQRSFVLNITGNDLSELQPDIPLIINIIYSTLSFFTFTDNILLEWKTLFYGFVVIKGLLSLLQIN